MTIKPKLTVSLHRWLDPVNHAQYADRGPDSAEFPHVVVRAVQVKRPVGRLQRLPVYVVELQIVDARELCAALVLVVHRFVFVLVPVRHRQVGQPFLHLVHDQLFRLHRHFIHPRLDGQQALVWRRRGPRDMEIYHVLQDHPSIHAAA